MLGTLLGLADLFIIWGFITYWDHFTGLDVFLFCWTVLLPTVVGVCWAFGRRMVLEAEMEEALKMALASLIVLAIAAYLVFRVLIVAREERIGALAAFGLREPSTAPWLLPPSWRGSSPAWLRGEVKRVDQPPRHEHSPI